MIKNLFEGSVNFVFGFVCAPVCVLFKKIKNDEFYKLAPLSNNGNKQ